MDNKIYLIHEDDYLNHIDGKLDMYELLTELVRAVRGNLEAGETAQAMRTLCAYENKAHEVSLHIQRQGQRPNHFQPAWKTTALAAHMPESVWDQWGTECVGEWQYSNWPAGVFQCQNHSMWLIHFTYHQLVEQI